MSAMLIRGMRSRMKLQIRRYAKSKDLSTNQALLSLINMAFETMNSEEEKENQRKQAFQDIRQLHQEMRRKYGRQDDSAKLIREMRDELSRRHDKDHS